MFCKDCVGNDLQSRAGLPQLFYELRVVRGGGGVPRSGIPNGGLSSVLFTFASRGDEPGFHRPACR